MAAAHQKHVLPSGTAEVGGHGHHCQKTLSCKAVTQSNEVMCSKPGISKPQSHMQLEANGPITPKGKAFFPKEEGFPHPQPGREVRAQ